MAASDPVTVATGALGPVLAKLTALLGDESKLPTGSRSDVEFIKSELEHVRSRLLKMWEWQDLDAACNWMAEARDLSYTMEDDIDDFMLGQGQEHVTSAIPFVESLKIQVEGLLGRWCDRWEYPAESSSSSSTSSKPNVDPRASFISKEIKKKKDQLLEIIEKKKDELIDLLRNHETVCIVGFSGIGKTTLAHLVYRAIEETFECRAFVSLSPSLNMMEVLKTILQDVRGGAPLEDTSASDEKQISDKIQNFLLDKRYIIVVDDIWRHPAEELELITRSLPKNNLGSRIVITTRFNAVAEKWGKSNDAFVYKIEGLSSDAAVALSESIIQEKKKDELIELLHNHEMVCIVGFAGMGKTTLAHLVYDANIGETFKCRAFVSLSPSLNKMEVLKTILQNVCNGAPLEDTNAWDEKQISHKIQNLLRNKRYIIVVDDIWRLEELELIRNSLPKNNLDSRIVITTRSNAVAEKWGMSNDAFVYKIEGLSSDAAVALSECIIQEPAQSFTTSSPEDRPCSAIAKMSGGIPLAVTCLSYAVKEQLSFLSKKQQLSSEDVEDLDLHAEAHKRLKLSLSQALDKFIQNSCMKPLVESLELGYRSLKGVALKTCLLYCCIYPPYQRFQRDDLIRIWIAERFVFEEEKAQICFDELVDWGYIWLVEGRLTKEQKYEINPIMLAFLKCQSWKYNFLSPVDSFTNISSLSGRRIHRASVQGGLSSSNISGLDFSRTRSFITFGHPSSVPFECFKRLRVLLLDGNYSLEEVNSENDDQTPLFLDEEITLLLKRNRITLRHDNQVITDKLLIPRPRHVIHQACETTMLPPDIGEQQYLETLDVSKTRIRRLPKEIGKLHHLNTLNISNTKVTELPRKIGELECLKTLIMSNTNFKELPKEIWKLQKLSTLDLSNTVVPSLPKDIGELKNLKTLNLSHTKVKEVPVEMRELEHLKILDISNTAVAELPSCIWELKLLKTLNLRNTKVAKLPGGIGKLEDLENLDISNTEIAELPRDLWELKLLKTLNLSNTKVTKILGKITNLKCLRTMDISSTVVRELPWEASQLLLSGSLVVLFGDMHCRKMVKLPQGVPKSQSGTDNSILSSDLSFMLFGRSGMNWEPLSVATLKVKKTNTRIEDLVPKYRLVDISSLDINLWKPDGNDLELLGDMEYLRTLVIRFDLVPRKIMNITCRGFKRLENFCVDCRLPWVSFEPGAMPKLRCLEFQFYACRENQDPIGIKHLLRLRRVVFQSVSPKMYRSDAPGISTIIKKVREEIREHTNLPITLCIDGVIQEIRMCTHICEENHNNNAGSSSGSNDNQTSLSKNDTDDYKGGIHYRNRQHFRRRPRHFMFNGVMHLRVESRAAQRIKWRSLGCTKH